MKKLLVFLFYICSVSMLVNQHPSAILATFLLQGYIEINRNLVLEALKK